MLIDLFAVALAEGERLRALRLAAAAVTSRERNGTHPREPVVDVAAVPVFPVPDEDAAEQAAWDEGARMDLETRSRTPSIAGRAGGTDMTDDRAAVEPIEIEIEAGQPAAMLTFR